MPSFTAIDVETANSTRASICQIGVIVVRGGQIVQEYEALVNPECAFERANIAVHGIRPAQVATAVTFHAVHEWLHVHLPDEIAVAHSSFDEQCLNQSAERYGLVRWQARWADSVVAAKRAFPELRERGYKLKTLADAFGIALNHHDALSDARASARIFLRALKATGLEPQDFVGHRLTRRKFASPRARERAARLAAYGMADVIGGIVFTGEMATIERVEAEALAACLGLRTSETIQEQTLFVCHGSNADNTAKYRRAKALIRTGLPLQLIDEETFIDLLRHNAAEAYAAFLAG